VSWLVGRLVVKEDRGVHIKRTQTYSRKVCYLDVKEMTADERVEKKTLPSLPFQHMAIVVYQ
jgi:hypothetical protein